MNKVVLSGRLTADPSVRYSTGENNTAIATFTLAVNRRFAKRDDPNAQTADFIRCQAFGKSAEFIEKWFKKGSAAIVEGRIQTGKYTNKEGQTVYTTDVIIENIEFGESKGASGNNGGQAAPTGNNGGGFNGGYQNMNNNGQPPFINIPDGVDQTLPFN